MKPKDSSPGISPHESHFVFRCESLLTKSFSEINELVTLDSEFPYFLILRYNHFIRGVQDENKPLVIDFSNLDVEEVLENINDRRERIAKIDTEPESKNLQMAKKDLEKAHLIITNRIEFGETVNEDPTSTYTPETSYFHYALGHQLGLVVSAENPDDDRFKDTALKHLSIAIKLNPFNFWAYFARGTLFSRMGELEKSIDDLTKSLILSPKASPFYYNRALCYLECGKVNMALSDFDSSILSNPQYYRGYDGKGDIYAEQKKFDLAVVEYSKALKIKPQSKHVRLSRGFAFFRLKQYDSAIKDFTNVVDRYQNRDDNSGKLIYALQCRGECLRRKELFVDAIVDYSRAISIEQSDRIGHLKFMRSIIVGELRKKIMNS